MPKDFTPENIAIQKTLAEKAWQGDDRAMNMLYDRYYDDWKDDLQGRRMTPRAFSNLVYESTSAQPDDVAVYKEADSAIPLEVQKNLLANVLTTARKRADKEDVALVAAVDVK